MVVANLFRLPCRAPRRQCMLPPMPPEHAGAIPHARHASLCMHAGSPCAPCISAHARMIPLRALHISEYACKTPVCAMRARPPCVRLCACMCISRAPPHPAHAYQIPNHQLLGATHACMHSGALPGDLSCAGRNGSACHKVVRTHGSVDLQQPFSLVQNIAPGLGEKDHPAIPPRGVQVRIEMAFGAVEGEKAKLQVHFRLEAVEDAEAEDDGQDCGHGEEEDRVPADEQAQLVAERPEPSVDHLPQHPPPPPPPPQPACGCSRPSSSKVRGTSGAKWPDEPRCLPRTFALTRSPRWLFLPLPLLPA
ncbi:Histone-lysine N-methyltransferase MLL4, partial [Ophiophagus hannah]